MVVQDLKQRVLIQRAFGLKGLDELLERQVLVRLRTKGRFASLIEYDL